MRRALVLALVLASACGQDDPVTPGPADLEQFDFDVDATLVVDDSGFSPTELRVGIGDVIELRNEGDEAHTVTARSGQFHVRLEPGETSTLILDETGRTRVHDTLAADNEGSIVVEAADDS
jgi:plastocyanin